MDANLIFYETTEYYCTECKSICQMYEQGLSCRCDNPWVTEVLDPVDYPDKWVEVDAVYATKQWIRGVNG